MATGETPGPSRTRPDLYFDDISKDELFANAPADETNDDKNTDVNATRSEMNDADVSVNLSLFRISQRLSTKSPTGCTLPSNGASCLSLRKHVRLRGYARANSS
jgi:hypothetical protein